MEIIEDIKGRTGMPDATYMQGHESPYVDLVPVAAPEEAKSPFHQGQFGAQAVMLDKALAARKNELRDVKIRATTRAVGIPEVVKANPTAEHFIYSNFHFSGGIEKPFLSAFRRPSPPLRLTGQSSGSLIF
jgi:hypothetical protein